MKTLITLLGTSPGTVTAAYYALCEQGYGPPERVVVVATEARETDECLKMIQGEFRRLEPAGPRLERAVVPIPDLEDEPTTKEFQAQVAAVLRRERDRPDNRVWLSIAGGRKSMAALAAIAAQLIGVDRMFHLYVARELEQHGDINQLLLDPDWQPRCLHPAKGKYTLVEVPFFELSVKQGQLRLLLEGRPVKARDAEGWLVDRAAPLEEAIPLCWKIASGGDHDVTFRPVEEGARKDLPETPAGTAPSPDPARAAAQQAIFRNIRDALSVPLAEALDLQARRSGAFMTSEECRRGVVGTAWTKTWNV